MRSALKALALGLFLLLQAAPALAASESLDNEYFSLALPSGWELVAVPAEQESGFALSMAKKSGDCLINFAIMPYGGQADSLFGEIRSAMAAKGIVLGEPRKDGDIRYCKFKRGDSGGIIYVCANGDEAGMTTIYGSAKLQREAYRILSEMRIRKGQGLFPDFKNLTRRN